MMDYAAILRQIVPGIKAVGAWQVDTMNSVQLSDIQYKGSNDLVSFVDQESERRLKEILGAAFPLAAFIAEESANDVSNVGDGYYWVVDPLDGTTNYLHKIPLFAISIALVYQKQPVLGCIYEPNLQECFTAAQGLGAQLNGKDIRVSGIQDLQKSLIVTGFPYYDFSYADRYFNFLKHLTKKTHGIRRLGTAATDLAYVACGRFESFFEVNLKPWDVAAGKIIVEEAGGTVVNFTGGPDVVFKGEIIASGACHEAFLSNFQSHWYE